VRDVLERVESGDADAGFVYRSDLTAVAEAAALGLLPLPARLALGIVYPASLTVAPPELVLAQAFVGFLLSEEGQAIFESFGFGNNQ
jgi:molybdate transport system substrate-binding protein